MNVLLTFLVAFALVVVVFLSTLGTLDERVLGDVGISSASLAVRFFPTIFSGFQLGCRWPRVQSKVTAMDGSKVERLST